MLEHDDDERNEMREIKSATRDGGGGAATYLLGGDSIRGGDGE